MQQDFEGKGTTSTKSRRWQGAQQVRRLPTLGGWELAVHGGICMSYGCMC